jgi:hypothetical protein
MKHLHTFILVPFALLLAGCPVSSDPAGREAESTDAALASDAGPSQPQAEPIDRLVQRTLRENLSDRALSSNTHGAWQILHGVLAYGDQFTIETPTGTQPAIKYLLDGGAVNGFEPMPGNPLGDPPRPGLNMEMQPTTKVGQGHRDQWLAILSQSGLAPETEIRSADGTFTIDDWVNQTEYDIPRNLELEFSWTLIALTAFRETSHTWQATDGRRYSIEALLESELQQDISASVCGGTHRLIGVSMALDQRRREKAPITGVWLRAQQLLNEAVALAKQNQNEDGSFSVAYLHRPGIARDLGERLGTTGHVLEFLAFAATDQTLQEPWVQRSARHLCQVLDDCKGIDLECGVLYHALHGLAEYQNRLQAIAANESGS